MRDQNFDLDVMDFDGVKEFWDFISSQSNWYLKFHPNRIKNINKYLSELRPLITHTTNKLREEMQFSDNDYTKILEWDNMTMNSISEESNKKIKSDPLKYRQFCAHCKAEIGYTPRYPMMICHRCTIELTDQNGRKVEFFNTDPLVYGCQGYFTGTHQTEKYDSIFCDLEGSEYFAVESRFGGIVIQRKG